MQPQDGEDAHPDFPGMLLEATLREGDAGFVLDATARNEGPNTYRVSNICVEPWDETLENDGGDLVYRSEPLAHCEAFGMGPFPPGAEESIQLTWDGDLWDEGHREPAPAGTYTWTILFEVFDEGEGTEFEQRERLAVPFTVEIH